ncbi:hypothetical protein FGRMN_9183 [Fusarium graminum]|nr:hypothetical protein FGRMN_9183 [Fusarium graminum]
MAPFPVLQPPGPMMPGMTPVVQASMLDSSCVVFVSTGLIFFIGVSVWTIRRTMAWRKASARPIVIMSNFTYNQINMAQPTNHENALTWHIIKELGFPVCITTVTLVQMMGIIATIHRIVQKNKSLHDDNCIRNSSVNKFFIYHGSVQLINFISMVLTGLCMCCVTALYWVEEIQEKETGPTTLAFGFPFTITILGMANSFQCISALQSLGALLNQVKSQDSELVDRQSQADCSGALVATVE